MSAKLEEGDFKGADRLVCSEDCLTDLDEETLAALKSKHPPPHTDTLFPPAPKEDSTFFTSILEGEVAKAIISFPKGSAGGSNGLSPQHLKDLIDVLNERGGRDFL